VGSDQSGVGALMVEILICRKVKTIFIERKIFWIRIFFNAFRKVQQSDMLKFFSTQTENKSSILRFTILDLTQRVFTVQGGGGDRKFKFLTQCFDKFSYPQNICYNKKKGKISRSLIF
jgi:hypothetical protein